MKDNIIKPDWFDAWFSRHFPDSNSQFSPKEVAAAFSVSDDSIYRAVKSGALCAFQRCRCSNIFIPREAVYDFAISCYTLNG